MVTLESIFNIDEQVMKNKSSLLVQQYHYEDLEILEGNNLKFGKVIPTKERQSYIHLFQDFNDFFLGNM